MLNDLLNVCCFLEIMNLQNWYHQLLKQAPMNEKLFDQMPVVDC